MSLPPALEPDRADSEPPRPARSRRARPLVSVSRNGDKHLSALSRVCIVALVWCAGGLWYWMSPRSPFFALRTEFQASTVLWYAVGAALIAGFHAVRGPEVQGPARLVWNGLTLAFASGLTLAALNAAVSAH